MTGLTIDNPTKWEKIIPSERIIPGDTLYLRGGTYAGDWVFAQNMSGTSQAPVSIRPYNGESVVFNGSVEIWGNYINLYDLDFTDTRDRHIVTKGVYIAGTGINVYGCHIQKMHASGISWYGHGPSEISENWIEDNGYLDANDNGHGYCIYAHNETPGEHLCQRNLMIWQRERYTWHCFTASNIPLYDFSVYDNVFDGAVHAGGGQGLKNYKHERNVHNDAWTQLGKYLWDEAEYQNDGTSIKDNLFIHTYFAIDYGSSEPLPNAWANLTESGNIAWNPPRAYEYDRSGYSVEAQPSHYEQFIPFTISARWSGIQVTLDNGVFTAAVVSK